jgi:hypothetical protein
MKPEWRSRRTSPQISLKTSAQTCLWTLTWLATLLCLPAVAAPLDGDLGSWLDEQAIPQVVSLLSNHPRFKGQVIDIVAMDEGYPTPTMSELVDSMRGQLTLALVRDTQVRIPLEGRCDDVHTVLGIDIDRTSASGFDVTLAMLDLDEGIWVNGTVQRWSGRLTSAQRRMLATVGREGRCDNLASPMVAGYGGSATGPGTGEGAAGDLEWRTDPGPDAGRELISEVIISDASSLCRDRNCMDVQIELFEVAFVLPFHTRDGVVTPLYCRLPARERPGTLRYGINVPDGDTPNRPSVGFYLMAVRDREVAREVLEVLVLASDACGDEVGAAPHQWLPRLDALLAARDSGVSWRALHLALEAGGIRRFE